MGTAGGRGGRAGAAPRASADTSSPQVLAAGPGPTPAQVPASPGEVLKDGGGLHPALEAGRAPLPDLLAPFVGDDLPTGLQDHKLGGGCDAVPGPQLTAERRGQARVSGRGSCAPRQPCTASGPRPPGARSLLPSASPSPSLGCSGLCCPRPWHRHEGQRSPHNVAAVTFILVHFHLNLRSHMSWLLYCEVQF